MAISLISVFVITGEDSPLTKNKTSGGAAQEARVRCCGWEAD